MGTYKREHIKDLKPTFYAEKIEKNKHLVPPIEDININNF
jgi:hypothetical protein